MKHHNWIRVGLCGALALSAAGIVMAASAQAQEYEEVGDASQAVGKNVTYQKWEIAQKPGRVTHLKKTMLDAHTVRFSWRHRDVHDGFRIYRKSGGQKSYHLISTVRKCRFTDHDLKVGKTYRYKIVPILRFRKKTYQGAPARIRYCYREIVSSDHAVYTYAEMVGDIRSLAARYPGKVRYQIIGKSEDGRGIYDVILGNPAASHKLLSVCSIHAREYVTAWLGMRQIEYYLENYEGKIGDKRVRGVLNQTAIHVVPMANPDGVSLSQSGVSSIRTRAFRPKISRWSRQGSARWKANARGVDLNRNFPYRFQKIGKRGAQGYSGKSAASETETKALIQLVRALKQTGLSGVVNYHATGSIVFGDCAESGTLEQQTAEMYTLARSLTGYGGAGGYHSDSGGKGNFREYVMYRQHIPCITLEVGTQQCPVPYGEYASIWKKNKRLLLEEADLF